MICDLCKKEPATHAADFWASGRDYKNVCKECRAALWEARAWGHGLSSHTILRLYPISKTDDSHAAGQRSGKQNTGG